MKKVQLARQQGFTLIELMIVIAIVGILAAIALPAYQDYTVRAKMAEPMAMLAEAKTSVSEFYVARGVLPTDQAESGILRTRLESTLVESLEWNAGVITVTMSGDPTLQAAANQSFELSGLTQANGTISWRCRIGSGTIDAKYLPSTCR